MKKLIFLVALLLLSGCSLATSRNQDTGRQPGNNNFGTAEILNLSRQNLTAVPAWVFDQTSLIELDLSYNNLGQALPSQLGKLKNLKKLDASHNQMTGVPAEIGQLENLETLDLSGNKLTGLPNELGNLKKLKTFNLSGNPYSSQDLAGIQSRLPSTNFILK